MSERALATPSSQVRRAAAYVASSIGSALGPGQSSVRVSLPDRTGRLRVVASIGHPPGSGRRRSSRRRWVYETGSGVAVPVRSAVEQTLSILPLQADGQTLGVLEVLAPARRVDERRDAILALTRQSGALVKSSQEQEATDRRILATERLLSLASSLNEATGPVAAMETVVDVCWRHLNVPMAIVRPDRSGDGWYLAAVAGIGARKRTALRQRLRTLPASRRHRAHLRHLAGAFAESLGSGAETIVVADAVLLMGAAAAGEAFVRQAASLLERTLERMAPRNGGHDELGVGIAWTAHELRAPLVGAKAALEHVLSSNGSSHGAGEVELLRRTKAELERLTDIVDPLLHWSIRGGKLRRRTADLVEIVRQAVTSTAQDFEAREVRLSAPDRLEIRADVMHLRSAIANVIRNALTYSPAGSPVEVEIEDHGRFARVRIHDRGPGIPPSERVAVFDPFVRGEAGRGARTGNGLGLFIARRVAEAHGGALRLDRPKRRGASFCFDLPRGGVEPRASAS